MPKKKVKKKDKTVRVHKYTNTTWAIFQLYHGENNLYFNEMIIMKTLYKTNMLKWIVLAHCNNSPRVNISLHSNNLSLYRVK